MIKNYYDAMVIAGGDVQNKRLEFLDTFAPAGNSPDYALGLGILLTLLQVPATFLGTVFWKGSE